jgi:hypothetical protein
MAVELRCVKHPKYKAVRFPRADCIYCRAIWYARTEFHYQILHLTNKERKVRMK